MGWRETSVVWCISVPAMCTGALHLIDVGIRMRVRSVADSTFEEAKPTLTPSSSRYIVEAVFWNTALYGFGEELLDICYAVLDFQVV